MTIVNCGIIASWTCSLEKCKFEINVPKKKLANILSESSER